MRSALRQLSLFIFLWTSPCWAAGTLFTAQNGTALSTTVTNYVGLVGDAAPDATESNAYFVMPITGTFRDMYVTVSAAPGAGASWTVTFRTGGTTNTAVTCTISGGAATTCNSGTTEVSVAGQTVVSIAFVPSAGTAPAAANMTVSIAFYSTQNGGADPQTIIAGSTGNANLTTTTATNYLSPQTFTVESATETDNELLIAAPGSIQNLFIRLSGDPDNGVGTQTYAFTVRQNETTNTTVTCSISSGSTTCADSTNVFTVVAGDRISLQVVDSGTPTGQIANYSMTFVPTSRGLFLMGMSGAVNMSATAVQYNRIFTDGGSWNATEGNRDMVLSGLNIQTMYVLLSAAPDNGAGTDSYAFQFRDDVGNNGPTCTVSEAATTCNNTTAGVVGAGSLCDTRVTPANTPTVAQARIGYAGFLKPPQRSIVQ